LNIEVRIIDRIILVASGGDFSERTGVDQLPTSKSGFKNFTVSTATVGAAAAQATHGHHTARAVGTLRGVAGIRALEIHCACPPYLSGWQYAFFFGYQVNQWDMSWMDQG
jgi:hypothetical protein